MRVIIKNADFSSVSIGKVVKDLSFEINSTNLSDYFLNPPTVPLPITAGTGHNSNATMYIASSGATSYTTQVSANRFVSKLIPVTPGMILTGVMWSNTNTIPSIICFDAQESPITPASTTNAAWSNNNAVGPFVIPEGTAYVKVQCSSLLDTSKMTGTMLQ